MNVRVFKALFAFSLGLVLLAAFAAVAQAQIAKSGKFTAHFGFFGVGTAHPVEEGHLFWVGEFSGTVFNDAGNGIFHRASSKCPAVSDIFLGGEANLHGYCILTDSDGDQAFIAWKCNGPALVSCSGDFQWTGGTGKYTGIRGDNTFQGIFVTQTEGYALWQAEYRLP